MTEQKLDLTVEQSGDITIFTLRSPRVTIELEGAFEQQLVQQVKALDTPKVLVDFSGVRFISSAILGKLIKLNGAVVADRGGQLRLCCLDRRIHDVFRITGLERLFSIHADRVEALKAFT